MCKCEKTRQIPAREQPFLNDQRSFRIMYTSGVDNVTSKKLKRREQREDENAARTEKYIKSVEKPPFKKLDVVQSDFEDGVLLSEIQSVIRSLRVTLSPEQRKGPQRMLKKLPKLVMACDRHCVSDRSAAAIASAVLEDFGIVSKHDLFHVVDRSKIQRARQQKRKELQDASSSHINLQSLYFDGKIDRTLTITKLGNKWYK